MKKIKIVTIITTLFLVLSLVLSAGCSVVIGPETQPITPPATSSPPTQNTPPIASGWEPPASGSQSPVLPSIADVVAEVKPSVVAITTEVVTRDFFNRPYTQEGAGSGWIIDAKGVIATNNHVVQGANSISVILDDGRTFPADMKTVATDPSTDLAVFRIDADNLTAATVGDSSKLRIGDWVVAIGNSLGQGIRATEGIVSRTHVTVPESQEILSDFIETSAAINPGNSGGPLVNMAGEVIGITSVKLVDVQIEGVGYAISSSEALPMIQQLITKGYVVRPFLGVQGLLTVDQTVATYFNLNINKGVLIRGIISGGPADKAGLKAGDVITKYAGQDITNLTEAIRAINSSQVGQQVEIVYWRGNNQHTTQVTLAESPPPS